MIKINILNRGPIFNWGKNFGYWFPIKYFKEELKDNGFQIDFYNSINDKILRDELVLNSQNICKSVYTEEGLKYFVKFFKKITE